MTVPTNIIAFLALITTLFLFYVFVLHVRWRNMWAVLLPPLAKKIPPYITPDHISVLGFVFPLISAFFLCLTKFNYFFYLAASLTLFVYAFVDSLDGTLARIRNQTSKRGAFLDYTLDKLAYLLLFFSFLLSGQVRAELIAIAMVFMLFYALINMESQVLIGKRLSVADRPRGLAGAIALCIAAFSFKFFGLDLIPFFGVEFRSFDVVFTIMPILQFWLILRRCIFLWGNLKKLDSEEKK